MEIARVAEENRRVAQVLSHENTARKQHESKQNAGQITPKRAKTMARIETINRLARPKYRIHVAQETKEHDRKSTRSQEEITDIAIRLHENTKGKRVNNTHRDTVTITRQNVDTDHVSERLVQPIKRKDQEKYSRGTAKHISELDDFVTRISTTKAHSGKPINRKVQIEKRCLSANDINDLCNRLADPIYTRPRTPDTRRLLDRTYSPVNTYAWQGLGFITTDSTLPII